MEFPFINPGHEHLECASPFRFLDLPPELQTAIFDHLLRPSHLAQACRVSRQIRQVALPLLYREISINVNVNQWNDGQLENFLAHGHPGHRHIRSIDVDSDDIEGELKALKVAKDVLSVLPWDCLRAFRCPLEEGVDNDLIILLAARQRSLNTLCIGTLRQNVLNLLGAHKPWPQSIETVIVPWRLLSPRDYTFYYELIQRSQKRLKALTVRVNEFAWRKEDSKGELTNSEELARGLFGHGEEKYLRPPLELRDINFQNQDLRAFDRTWNHYVNFSRLRTIQIWNCANTDMMLSCLSSLAKSQPLRLEGLVLSFEDSAHTPRLAEDFLRSISGLRYLNLCYNPSDNGQTSFDVKCLSSHFDTLEDLYIGIGTNVSRGPGSLQKLTESEIRLLASRCCRVKQLAIALPPISIDDILTGRLGEYFFHLKLLATLPRLKVLRILTWPIDSNERFDVVWYRHKQRHDVYVQHLDVVADTIARLFAHHRQARDDHNHDRLSVLTFGSAERGDSVQTWPNGYMSMPKPVTYKVRRVQSEFGMLLETARVEAGEMKYEEPIAYVFDEDTDQGLSLESYPWGCSD